MNVVSQWQLSLEPLGILFNPDTVATDLYRCSRQLFLEILKNPVQESHYAFLQNLRHQAQRFSIWGSNFKAQEGGLDKRLVGADRLKEVLLPLLASVGEALVIIAQRLGKEGELVELCSRVEHLKAQISHLAKRNPGDPADGNELSSADLLDELDSSSSDSLIVNELEELEELLQDIRSCNTCLFGLSSVLQEPAESVSIDLDKSKEEIELGQDMPANSAWLFISRIREAYPLIKPDFARRLGEANELRYLRLQKKRDEAEARDTGVESDTSSEDVAYIGRPAQSMSRASSHLSSLFDDARNDSGNKKHAEPTIAASVTTFESSPEGKEQERLFPGMPKMPEDEPQHVYRDLQPYSCSFPDCNFGNKTFTSRHQWADHEFTEHRRQVQWTCNQCDTVFANKADLRKHLCQIHVELTQSQVTREERLAEKKSLVQEECPFCLDASPFTVNEFISHVGMHMQQVARMVIPPSARSDDTEDVEDIDDAYSDEFEVKDEAGGAWDEEKAALRVRKLGFTQVDGHAKDHDFIADVIFVHGLQGHPKRTWQSESSTETHKGLGNRLKHFSISTPENDDHEDNRVFWPADLLPRDFNDVRILTYGYDSGVTKAFKGPTSSNGLFQHGRSFLEALSRVRADCGERPIVFVAHSLGGLIVKQALIEARKQANEPSLHDTYSNTHAVIFFGTPHRGSESVSWGLLLRGIARASQMEPNDAILMDLDPQSGNSKLEELRLDFDDILCDRQRAKKLRVSSFQEEKSMTGVKLLGSKVVPDGSSSFDSRRHGSDTIHANHMGMCRFEGVNDPGYQKFKVVLANFIDELKTEQQNARQARLQRDATHKADLLGNPWKSSTKKSYRSTDPSSIPTLFSDSGAHDSANTLTDPITSNSLSEVEQSSSKPITSISARESSSCKKCKTTFSDPAGMENHSCPSHGMAYFRDRLLSRLRPRESHVMALDPEEFVRIWHRNGQNYKEFRIALIDSGADVNLIRRSIVEELELETTRVTPTTLTALDNHVFSVNERVQPEWQFHIGSWRHQEFPFFVVSEIPGNRDMVLGNIARIELGLEFLASGVLVAQEDHQEIIPL